ncbi:carotenoid ester lipase precursor [Auriscalpium vulgare]|uniref:Carotenoid ester lipase n=1 Tax=Auriscalpium vulgare TaxID=40419 RepID=A0ACB8RLT3_9AGAM|nr:carotenoid ester lipase precursor [Auriscalpium vulgare]
MFTPRAATLASLALASGALASSQAPPAVYLDRATFIGNASGVVTQFLGIPFALPPVGDLRLRLPLPNAPYTGVHNASAFGPACIQQLGSPLPIPAGFSPVALQYLEGLDYGASVVDSEDCLTINVVKPASATGSTKLPVLVWIYGGGFETGASQTYNGSAIVERSIQLGQPIVYVSMNYRLSALGFPGGVEVQKAGVGNLGLHDQRLALRWIQKYIHAFGGDPSKVTISGQSAGAISVSLHLVTNGGNTEGLFRGAFMQSGSPLGVGPVAEGQPFYDALVANVSCAAAKDTLQCLREAPIDRLRTAINASPDINTFQSLNLAWQPRVDGIFLKDDPQRLVLQNSVAKVPLVSGDCDDEGTLFSFSTSNLTTDAEVRAYVAANYFKGVPSADIDAILAAYPNDTAQGSPFDTGALNALTPQYKRLAALQGDLVFQAPRRFFLRQRAGKQPLFSYLSKRHKTLPDVGSFHGSDAYLLYGPSDMTDYLIRFVTHLDPNVGASADPLASLFWPPYTTAAPQLLTFLDGAVPLNITLDTYRAEGMAELTRVSLAHPL